MNVILLWNWTYSLELAANWDKVRLEFLIMSWLCSGIIWYTLLSPIASCKLRSIKESFKKKSDIADNLHLLTIEISQNCLDFESTSTSGCYTSFYFVFFYIAIRQFILWEGFDDIIIYIRVLRAITLLLIYDILFNYISLLYVI